MYMHKYLFVHVCIETYAHTCIGVLRTGAHSHIYTQKDGWVGGWMDG